MRVSATHVLRPRGPPLLGRHVIHMYSCHVIYISHRHAIPSSEYHATHISGCHVISAPSYHTAGGPVIQVACIQVKRIKCAPQPTRYPLHVITTYLILLSFPLFRYRLAAAALRAADVSRLVELPVGLQRGLQKLKPGGLPRGWQRQRGPGGPSAILCCPLCCAPHVQPRVWIRPPRRRFCGALSFGFPDWRGFFGSDVITIGISHIGANHHGVATSDFSIAGSHVFILTRIVYTVTVPPAWSHCTTTGQLRVPRGHLRGAFRVVHQLVVRVGRNPRRSFRRGNRYDLRGGSIGSGSPMATECGVASGGRGSAGATWQSSVAG